MITSVVRRNTGMRGLNDAFNPAVPYAAKQNFLDMQADPSVQSRVNQIVNSGSVGNYSNYPVYNEYSTGQVWVSIGLSYPKLQEIVPVAPTTAPPPTTQSDCPCNNCHEETVIETWYASKEQTSSSDVPVNMTSEVVVCEPTENSAPRPLCANDIAALNAQGINGLADTVWSMSDRRKKCIDGCEGLPRDAWNTCMSKCNTIVNSPSIAGIGAASLGESRFQQNLQYTGLKSEQGPVTISRTADSSWGKCVDGCNSQRLSQAELQKCYAGCGTTTVSSNGYAVAPGGNLVALSGLSNDNSVQTDPIVYDAPPVYYTQPTMDCQQGSNNTMAFVLVGIGGAIVGGLLVKAIIKTR